MTVVKMVQAPQKGASAIEARMTYEEEIEQLMKKYSISEDEAHELWELTQTAANAEGEDELPTLQ